MMHVFRVLLLILSAPAALAEQNKPNSPVYSAQSQLTVDNINKAVGIIRDPTQMSMNFRQALKNIVPEAQANIPATGPAGSANALPFVELAGKVLTPDKPAIAVLRINSHPVHIEEGGSTSMINDGKFLTVRVDEITEQHVKVMLVELNKPLILQ